MTARLLAYLSYRDAPAALQWLEAVGFDMVRLVDDVDGHHTRAVDAGGTTGFEPEDTEWGTRRARVLDPDGVEWSFGAYPPGETGSARTVPRGAIGVTREQRSQCCHQAACPTDSPAR